MLHAAHISSSAAPSWTSIVSGRTCVSVQLQPKPIARATKGDFFALYERCVASGLQASINIHHSLTLQDKYISCSLPSPSPVGFAPVAQHCRCHRRHVHAATVAATATPQPSPPPALLPALHPALSPPTPSSTPPAKAPTGQQRGDVELLMRRLFYISRLCLAANLHHCHQHWIPPGYRIILLYHLDHRPWQLCCQC